MANVHKNSTICFYKILCCDPNIAILHRKNATVTRTSNPKLSFNFDQFHDLNACSVRSKILTNILLDLLITLLYLDPCLLIIAQVHFMSP